VDLVVRDTKTGEEVVACIGIQDYKLDDDDDYMVPFVVAEEIDRAVARLFIWRLRMAGKMFKAGDRVMAYSNKGRQGKGTVVPSKDSRLSDYIRVRLDRGGLEAYYRADFCKRLVPKKKEEDVHGSGE
jgi:hypothetical protein